MKSLPKLKIALIQTALHWKDKTANFAMLEEKIWEIEENVDLIVLPEMFSTGFTMDASEMAEPMNFTACKWLKQMASQTQSAVTGSVIIQENGNFFNRMLWAKPDGELLWYDKRHLFRMANEDEIYSMGKVRKIFELNGWKILPQVCYDLRFPVWSRNSSDEGLMEYDICVYIASWPKPRIKAWDILLQARAVENLAYALGVNRVGEDGNQVPYSGHSAAYNFKGEQMVYSEDKEETLIVEFDANDLRTYRDKFPAWKDADQFNIL
ncbi:putative amidohydrolase [Belliella baltica DSM 15883]|uniref:Omega-amidase YafV n=1 Tax=Belliella baltica (strain DSM 15883 / CIP 108006 / LMG 21964 / BA134) TaxID=866536 RepID=I3ZAR2_BELBD|nr:amidohydrolase [Belliella baltica]AFL86330.1 putative amidohydrolase [Belliella baltica DSM 15883]